jgi:hypothetical protein
MPYPSHSTTKTIAWLSLAVLVPLATMSLYLFIARGNGKVDSDTHFYLAFGASEVCGMICMYMFSRALGWASRSVAVSVSIIAVYSGVATVALFFYSLEFLCAVLHDCL